MPYVTDTQLGSISDLSTGLPTAELRPNDWVVVAQVALPTGSLLAWKMAMLKLYASTGAPSAAVIPTPPGTPQIGTVFAFITDQYAGSVDSSLLLTGFNSVPCPRVDLVSLTALSSATLSAPVSIQVPSPGKTYTIVVVNNTVSNSLSVALTGQLRVTQP